MKNDVNSINMAPDPIRFACRRIAGMAMLPTAEAPVKNFAISTHPPSSLETKKSVDPPAKNKHGIGTNTYIKADNIGHQLLYRAQARICNRILAENINAKPASTPIDIPMMDCVNLHFLLL